MQDVARVVMCRQLRGTADARSSSMKSSTTMMGSPSFVPPDLPAGGRMGIHHHKCLAQTRRAPVERLSADPTAALRVHVYTQVALTREVVELFDHARKLIVGQLELVHDVSVLVPHSLELAAPSHEVQGAARLPHCATCAGPLRCAASSCYHSRRGSRLERQESCALLCEMVVVPKHHVGSLLLQLMPQFSQC